MFWTFTLSFDEDILAFFSLAIVLATFSAIWPNLFAIFWSPSKQEIPRQTETKHKNASWAECGRTTIGLTCSGECDI